MLHVLVISFSCSFSCSCSYPDASVPILQLSLKSPLDAAEHVRVGALLAPLRAKGVLIVGSGALTHNFGEFGRPGEKPAPSGWTKEFEDWVTEAVALDDVAERNRRLSSIMTLAPHAKRAHPTADHLLPIVMAAGAAVNPDGTAAVGKKVFEGCVVDTMSLAAYLFE
jgi:4,5-DOPA dioxygenase extradiol